MMKNIYLNGLIDWAAPTGLAIPYAPNCYRQRGSYGAGIFQAPSGASRL
jgi:hypothetical protein